MILHLVTKHFFSNTGLSVFEKRAPGQNIVLVIGSMPNAVKSVNNGIEVSDENVCEVVKSIDFSNVNQVVIHYLTGKIASFVRSYIPEGIPLYWWTYGGDLYQPFLERRGYDVFYTDLTPFRPGWVYMTYRFLQICRNRILYNLGVFGHDKYVQRELLHRIRGMIPCIPPDHEMACKYLKRHLEIVRVHPFGYPLYDEVFYNGNVISVGHSASYSDNHLYALKFLSKIDIKDSAISLTLSYNVNSNKYVDAVKKRYRKQFNEKVNFVVDYLKEDYYKSQNEVKIMILPTWRQEALANVISCFLKGIKLFLSKRGPMYSHFKEYGFKCFAIEDISQNIFETPLTLEEKQYNRSLMLQYLDEKERTIDVDFKLFFDDFKTNKQSD